MEILHALKIIKKGLRKRVVESRHFREQCINRGLDIINVRESATKENILGIVEQDENLYKIWFRYEKEKDLNIIIRMLSGRSLRLVTLFPCYSERRKR